MPDGSTPGRVGMIRRVVIQKDPDHGLGLAVIGGKQLGVPILGKFTGSISLVPRHRCDRSIDDTREIPPAIK